jgi:hypothetical protein
LLEQIARTALANISTKSAPLIKKNGTPGSPAHSAGQ